MGRYVKVLIVSLINMNKKCTLVPVGTIEKTSCPSHDLAVGSSSVQFIVCSHGDHTHLFVCERMKDCSAADKLSQPAISAIFSNNAAEIMVGHVSVRLYIVCDA